MRTTRICALLVCSVFLSHASLGQAQSDAGAAGAPALQEPLSPASEVAPAPEPSPPTAASAPEPVTPSESTGLGRLSPRTARLHTPDPVLAPQAFDDESPEIQTSSNAAAEAIAELAPHFGAAGSAMLSIHLGGTLQHWSASDASWGAVQLAPSFDYFITRNIALGFEVTLSYSVSRSYGADGSLVQTKNSLVSAGPRFGWNVPLGERWSVFPSATFGLHRAEEHHRLVSGDSVSTANSETGASSIARTGPWVSFYAPLLLQLAPHFLLGFGPLLYHDFARAIGDSGAERTEIGASLFVGGFWGGEESDRVAPLYYARNSNSRFGAAGTLMLSGELSLSGVWSTYSGTDAGETRFTIGPSADWFVANDVAIGAAVFYQNGSRRGYQPDGVQVTYDYEYVGAFARIRIHDALSSAVSWLPSLAFGIRLTDQDEHSENASNTAKYTQLQVSLSAPLLVHIASHYFIGIGPELSHDLTDSRPFENLATTLGIRTTAGGWF